MKETNKNIFYILMFFAMIAWGISWVNGKILSAYINEYELIVFRNFFSLITLIPILILSKRYFHINIRSLILAIINAFLMVVYLKYYLLGLKFGTASLGGALVTTLIPIITFIIMVLFFAKKIEKKDIFALFLGAIGVLTILNIWSMSYEQIFNTSNTYFLLAAFTWSAITILSSKTTKTSPLVFSFYTYLFMFIGTWIFFVDISQVKFDSFDHIFWINILFLAIVSTTFATTIYFVGIEKLGTSEVSSFMFLVPIFAILGSVIFLNEHIGLNIIIGTILTLSAVKILNNIKILKR